MDIKVLGSGCRNCQLLEQRTREALDAIGRDATIEKVTDFGRIVSYGVMSTPALLVDGAVAVSGRVPTSRHLAELLSAAVPS
jgi:small redox-active disulfide protein 2